MIRLLIAVAVALFVLSLPIWKTRLGVKLRLIAGFCFVLAFLPSLIMGLLFPSLSGDAARATPGAMPSVLDQLAAGLSCVGALVVLSLLAYGALYVRKRVCKPEQQKSSSPLGRGAGKRRVDRERVDTDRPDREGW